MKVAIDIETTGAVNFNSIRNKQWDDPAWKAIDVAQFAWCEIDDNNVITGKGSFFIKPTKNTPVNNIYCPNLTQEICLDKGISKKKAIRTLQNIFKEANLIIAHNIDFDVNLLASWVNKYGYEELAHKIIEKDTFCTMKSGPQDNGRYPKLTVLCDKLNVPKMTCHDAVDDVEMTSRCYLAMKGLRMTNP